MTRGAVSCVLIVSGWLSIAVADARNQGRGGPPPTVTIQQVKDDLYMLRGGGGNSAVFVADRGVVLVDTNFANYGQVMLDTIRTVTDKPVTMIINTHSHGDHVGSNEFFGSTVEIVAHENARAAMEKTDAFKGEKAAFLPKTVYENRMTLGNGRDQIELYHYGAAHTNNDTWVVFKRARVMHAGDGFADKMSPLVDTGGGGSSLNFPRVVRQATQIRGIDTIITGHGPLMTPVDLEGYAEFLGSFVTFVTAQKNAGKTVDQTAAEYKLPEGYMPLPYLGGVRGWVEITYKELDAK